jgi:hypothetical protein
MKHFKHLKFVEKHNYLILDSREPYRLDTLTYGEMQYLARKYEGKCNVVTCQEGHIYIYVT